MFGDGILGHRRQKELLQKALESNRVASSYLFTGPDGIGKKLLARSLIQVLFCEKKTACGECVGCRKFDSDSHPDLFCLEETEGSIKIEELRQIQNYLKFHPLEASRKVCLINDADRMTTAAQSAFLKTLEEPRDNTLFILISAQPEALLPTIRSRCQILNFGRIPREDLRRHLIEQHHMEEIEARILAAVANGSLTKALSENGHFYRHERKKIIASVAALPAALDHILPHFQLSSQWVKEKVERRPLLEILRFFFRDILFMLEGKPDSDLINADLLPIIRERAEKETVDSVLNKLGALRQAERALDFNVNFQLLADVLVMRLSTPATGS